MIFLLAAILGAMPLHGNAAENDNGIAVHVDIQGDVVRVDVDLIIHATPKEVWDVVTDFEHLPQYISNITASKVLSHKGNIMRIAQAGVTSFGPLTFRFQSERELTLTPFERIESRMLSGNMKRFRGVTQLSTADGKTRIRYHSEAEPDTFLPLGLGKLLIESETREHYQEIRHEIARRKTPGMGR